MFKIGRVTHYYDKIGVVVVELDGSLAVGDKVKFVEGNEVLFEQTINSIQVGHEKRTATNKGDVVGLQTQKPVKEGTELYKL